MSKVPIGFLFQNSYKTTFMIFSAKFETKLILPMSKTSEIFKKSLFVVDEWLKGKKFARASSEMHPEGNKTDFCSRGCSAKPR